METESLYFTLWLQDFMGTIVNLIIILYHHKEIIRVIKMSENKKNLNKTV